MDTAGGAVLLTAGDFLLDTDAAAMDGRVLDVCGLFSAWTSTEVTLVTQGWSDPLVFELDRRAVHERWPIAEQWTLVRMKGRYAGRENGRHRFQESAISRPVTAQDFPAAIRAAAPDLSRTYAPEHFDLATLRRYSGRVVEVRGVVARVDATDVVLHGHGPDAVVRCRLAEPAGLASFEAGSSVTLKGFCAGHEIMTMGVVLHACVRP